MNDDAPWLFCGTSVMIRPIILWHAETVSCCTEVHQLVLHPGGESRNYSHSICVGTVADHLCYLPFAMCQEGLGPFIIGLKKY